MNSIEWLMQTLEQNNMIDLDWGESDKYYTIIEQAKEMHRKETIEAFEMGRFNIDDMGNGEEYYKETYKK